MSVPNEEITNLTARELADVIWLIAQIGQSSDTAEDSPVKSIEAEVREVPSSPQIIEPPVSSTEILEPEVKAPEVDFVEAYAPPSQASKSDSQSGLKLKIGDPLALRNALALGRSLRPLMRKVPSLTETVLDEEATVRNIADKDLWLPVFQPGSSRWLEIALAIEKTPRYPLWEQTLKEFQQLLERRGAFRNVRRWYLIDDKGEPKLYSKNRQANFKELRDPSGKRLILAISDCVSDIWHNGSLLKELRSNYTSIQPVSLLQLLPENFWSRTALGWGIDVRLSSENSGVPNTRLLTTPQSVEKYFDKYSIDESQEVNSQEVKIEKVLTSQLLTLQLLTLPIVTLEDSPMKNWAKVVAGVGRSRTAGLVFCPEEIKHQFIEDARNEDEKLSAEARVNRFWAAAHPLSRQLARMMAAAPVSLPVIRLIQKNLLPESNTIHVAEVFMGGLLKHEKNDSSNRNPNQPTSDNVIATQGSNPNQPTSNLNEHEPTGKEELQYEFYDGVREEIIKITPINQTLDVIDRLSEFINEELQSKNSSSVKTFDAILFDPHTKIEPDYLPFARITAETLKILGGKYADYGQEIWEKTYDPEKNTLTKEYLEELMGISLRPFNFNYKILEITPEEPPKQELQTFEFETVTVNARGEITKREQKQASYFVQPLTEELGIEMVAIPGGSFLMGSPEDEPKRRDNEGPQHTVTVQPFFMGKYPVTQAQWRFVAQLPQLERELETEPSRFEGNNLPVERVSWYDTEEFCKRLSKHTDREYRLPSEAEWEYACRAGTTTPFYFGETITGELANYAARNTFAKETPGKRRQKTTEVGVFLPNFFGLYDMHGNVWNWCFDDWHNKYEQAPIDGSAWTKINKGSQQNRVLRGGSWNLNPEYCRSAYRNDYNPEFRNINIGFRVVCAVAQRNLQ